MALETVPTDLAGDDLVRTYQQGIARLEAQVRRALEQGLDPSRIGTAAQLPGDATAAYRQRQLLASRAIVANLRATGRRASLATVTNAYSSAVVAVDRTLATAGQAAVGLQGRFGGVHQRAVEALSANMANTLDQAAARTGTSIEAVFARANRLEGALTPGGSPLGGFPFLGRRQNDAWRQVTLETIGAGQVGLDTREQISHTLARRLIDDGVTDALTGYVDRAGRRWPLDVYTEMAVRTTTREATTRAALSRMTEHGVDVVTITSHPHVADECTPYDGQTFALPGTPAAAAGTYDVLDELPPFHPRCRHVLTPGAANADDYLEELERAAKERNAPQIASQQPPPPRPPAPKAKPPAPTPDLPNVNAERVDQALEVGGRIRRRALERAKERTAASLAEHRALRHELRPLEDKIAVVIEAAQRAGPGHPDYDDAFDRLRPLRARRLELEERIRTLREARGTAQTDALLETLAEQRADFGTGKITNAVGDRQATTLIEDVARYLPREWIDESNAAGTIEVKLSKGRGLHRRGTAGGSKIDIRDDRWNALHELGHRLQQRMPLLHELEREFYLRRVRGPDGKLDPAEKLRDVVPGAAYKADEITRGAWTNPYIGKDYATSFERSKLGVEADPREVLTMGLEGLFGRRYDVVRGDFGPDVPHDLLRAIENLRSYVPTPRRRRAHERRLRNLERRLELIERGDDELADFILGLLARY